MKHKQLCLKLKWTELILRIEKAIPSCNFAKEFYRIPCLIQIQGALLSSRLLLHYLLNKKVALFCMTPQSVQMCYTGNKLYWLYLVK
ncbi:hypothetical protein O7U_01279 [Bartonella quintana JK 68]|uniref:Uncharacterized protein n=1 Tax=Bartonella quintana JK 68 TaxID=1134503 RepID=A0ABR4SN46_BARQI|nr:hypothetical protein Q651_00952 [Bartonella quintana BQ2-D70]KEC60992.1 hypothetical protein O91_00922 [Bartonella quintana JK 31]KEC61318.1 hypothetical protein O7Y_01283 [Bartonella quintana JK 63]KEC64613.1 hypothetical protein O7U_01279 [Bartonella quintana JK 68]KEC64782.1 hypothetical protein O7W_00629 [Bartonella quintana JK 56]KEC64884.1 hypothetical protein O7S_01273 [Bartonella quintana JK 67]